MPLSLCNVEMCMIAKLRGYNNIAKESGSAEGSKIFHIDSRLLSKIVDESPLSFEVKCYIFVEGNKRGYYY